MSTDLLTQLAEYGRYHRDEQHPVTSHDLLSALEGAAPAPDQTIPTISIASSPPPRWRPVWAIVAAVSVMLLLIGGAAVLPRLQSPAETAAQPTDGTVVRYEPARDASPTLATAATPLPDFEGAVAGDDGGGPLPLGAVGELPDSVRLDFLFEFCGWYGPECFRDAHFMDPAGTGLGSGPWPAGTPFHIREGFVNDGDEPLPDGFDVVVYVTPMDGAPSEAGGVPDGGTVRYTSDYVVRGEADRCGPTYRTQSGPVTCEWFVHDFPDGLPEGRFAIWAVWEAPCSGWLELGFTDRCDDPDEVTSMFASGVDSPVGPFEASFSEQPGGP